MEATQEPSNEMRPGEEKVTWEGENCSVTYILSDTVDEGTGDSESTDAGKRLGNQAHVLRRKREGKEEESYGERRPRCRRHKRSEETPRRKGKMNFTDTSTTTTQ